MVYKDYNGQAEEKKGTDEILSRLDNIEKKVVKSNEILARLDNVVRKVSWIRMK